MIINLRGTSGSGKSTAVRYVMAGGSVSEVRADPVDKHPIGYAVSGAVDGVVSVVGKYTTACGGCDTIKTQDEICGRVRRFATDGHVLFEGLLISHLFSRYAALSDELGGICFGFLDTPLEVCLERVRARRAARGNTKPLNEKNTVQKWHDMRRVYGKFRDAGHNAVWVPNETAGQWVIDMLRLREMKDYDRRASSTAG